MDIDHKILTIEDEPALRRSIAAFLIDLGFAVVEAEDGDHGLRLFERERPDLVLTDLDMPVLDGFAVVERLSKTYPDTPVVVISGVDSVKHAIETVRKGAWDYITKPICDFGELEKVIKKSLKRAKELREARLRTANLERLVAEQSNLLKASRIDDPVTGLPNRTKFNEWFQEVTENHHEAVATSCYLLNINNLQQFNEMYGHDAGDLMLASIAKRLRLLASEQVRIFRVSGAKFVIAKANPDYFSSFPEDVVRVFERPFHAGSNDFYVNVSVGISVFPRDGDSVNKILQRAETALSEAVLLGKNKYLCYSTDLRHKVQTRIMLESRLRKALGNEEFFLHYQPKINARSNRVIGMEALLRWCPEGNGGTIPPGEFIPVLEETGLIDAVGLWVLRKACEQFVVWKMESEQALVLSVNVSAVQLRSITFIDSIKKILRETGMPPANLCLEITESILIKDTENVIDVLKRLFDLGLKISLDDFGTGYSSLMYLVRMPLSEIKIDQLFVKNINSDKESREIIESIIAMAHGINLSVVAEGVETYEQFEFLQAKEADEIQGFYFSRPLSQEEMTAYLGLDRNGVMELGK